MDTITALTARMIALNAREPALTHHLLKVHGFAKAIATLEGLDQQNLYTLELAALTHDIAIGHCMRVYGRCTGKMQEAEGPALARALLSQLDIDGQTIERVCYLIAHHHTYTDMDGMDYQILVEADFLVNLYEGNQSRQAMDAACRDIFRTQTGRRFFLDLYGA